MNLNLDVCDYCLSTELTSNNTQHKDDEHHGIAIVGDVCDNCWKQLIIPMLDRIRLNRPKFILDNTSNISNEKKMLVLNEIKNRRSNNKLTREQFLQFPAEELLSFRDYFGMSDTAFERGKKSLESLQMTIFQFLNHFTPTQVFRNIEGFHNNNLIASIRKFLKRRFQIQWGKAKYFEEKRHQKWVLMKDGRLQLLVYTLFNGRNVSASRTMTKKEVVNMGFEAAKQLMLEKYLEELYLRVEGRIKLYRRKIIVSEPLQMMAINDKYQ